MKTIEKIKRRTAATILTTERKFTWTVSKLLHMDVPHAPPLGGASSLAERMAQVDKFRAQRDADILAAFKVYALGCAGFGMIFVFYNLLA